MSSSCYLLGPLVMLLALNIGLASTFSIRSVANHLRESGSYMDSEDVSLHDRTYLATAGREFHLVIVIKNQKIYYIDQTGIHMLFSLLIKGSNSCWITHCKLSAFNITKSNNYFSKMKHNPFCFCQLLAFMTFVLCEVISFQKSCLFSRVLTL